MAQILTPIALLGAAYQIASISHDADEVSADGIQYGSMAPKASSKQNPSIPSDSSEVPSWAIGSRMRVKELGVATKKNLVGYWSKGRIWYYEIIN